MTNTKRRPKKDVTHVEPKPVTTQTIIVPKDPPAVPSPKVVPKMSKRVVIGAAVELERTKFMQEKEEQKARKAAIDVAMLGAIMEMFRQKEKEGSVGMHLTEVDLKFTVRKGDCGGYESVRTLDLSDYLHLPTLKENQKVRAEQDHVTFTIVMPLELHRPEQKDTVLVYRNALDIYKLQEAIRQLFNEEEVRRKITEALDTSKDQIRLILSNQENIDRLEELMAKVHGVKTLEAPTILTRLD